MVHRNRFREARDAGLAIWEAELYADDPTMDTGTLRKLVKGRCDVRLIREILGFTELRPGD